MFERNEGQALTPRGAALVGASDIAKREPEAQRILSRQTSIVSELEELCSQLESRLQPVLSNLANSQDNEKNPPRMSPPLLGAIDENTERVFKANVFLSELLRRLEI